MMKQKLFSYTRMRFKAKYLVLSVVAFLGTLTSHFKVGVNIARNLPAFPPTSVKEQNTLTAVSPMELPWILLTPTIHKK